MAFGAILTLKVGKKHLEMSKIAHLAQSVQLGNAPVPEATASFFPAVVLLFNPHRQDACAAKCVAYRINRSNKEFQE